MTYWDRDHRENVAGNTAAIADAVAEAIDQARRGNEGAVIDFLEGLR